MLTMAKTHLVVDLPLDVLALHNPCFPCYSFLY